MPTKKDVLQYGANIQNLLSKAGATFKAEKTRRIEQDIVRNFSNPDKILFNEDGTSKTPYEIGGTLMKGYQSLMSIGSKDMATGLMAHYKDLIARQDVRAQNTLFGNVIKERYPKIYPALKDADLDRTDVEKTVKGFKEARPELYKFTWSPVYKDETTGKFYKDRFRESRYGGESEKVETVEVPDPTHRTSKNISIRNFPPMEYGRANVKNDVTGEEKTVKYNPVKGQFEDMETGKFFDMEGWHEVSKDAENVEELTGALSGEEVNEWMTDNEKNIEAITGDKRVAKDIRAYLAGGDWQEWMTDIVRNEPNSALAKILNDAYNTRERKK